jgi:UDP-N-acetylglucosamine--N-acetylmuramyl-(pentapeptide) pyrophosphoryl-undecaprenol N-acetylglucosamine transferase
MMESKFRVLIAASGTGGHLFPAVYIANELRDKYSAEVQFIGSGRPLEQKIVEGAGYKRSVIDTVGLRRLGLKGFFQWLQKLPRAIIKTWQVISRTQPDVIVGVGGYVSFLPVFIGFLRGIPTWIHEAERKPGLANFFLSLIATRISTAYPQVNFLRSGNAVYTGHPLRPELLDADFSIDPANILPKKILILGGSQGSEGLDKGVISLCADFKEHDCSIWHQSRTENAPWLTEEYRKGAVSAKVVAFIDAVEEAYKWSDIIISRAGAGTVRELFVANRPAILIPLPKAEEQYLNAREIVNAGRGVLVEEGEGYFERLKAAFSAVSSKDRYAQLFSPLKNELKKDAAGEIARLIKGLA